MPAPETSARSPALRAIPILLYHSVSDAPSEKLASFTVSPGVFASHLDAIVESGATALTVSQYVAALDADVLPERFVVITFDDGYADFLDVALPALEERDLRCTLYVPTGFLEGRPDLRVARRPPDRFLQWAQLPELAARGVEVGGHSHSHFHLDTLSVGAARDEIQSCKALLEDALQMPVTSFAYPNGFSSGAVRRLVAQVGYQSACGVRNAFSHERDDRFQLARLMVRSTTGQERFGSWLRGAGARLAPPDEPLRTRVFRAYRRARARLAGEPRSDFDLSSNTYAAPRR